MRKLSWAQASVLMLAVVASRAIAYVFSKTALLELSALCLLSIRFLLAFGILMLIFGRKISKAQVSELVQGAVLGALLAGVMVLEMHALPITETSIVSFLENSATVLVPILAFALFKEKLGPLTAVAMLLALAGVALLTLSGGLGKFGLGEAYALCAAVLYTAFILATGRFSRMSDPLVLGVVQLGVAGVLCLAASFAFETPIIPTKPETWGCIAVLVLVCSVFGFTCQPIAQKHIPSDQAAFTLVLNPVIATMVGVAFLGERLTAVQLVGAALILAALVLSILAQKAKAKQAMGKGQAKDKGAGEVGGS